MGFELMLTLTRNILWIEVLTDFSCMHVSRLLLLMNPAFAGFSDDYGLVREVQISKFIHESVLCKARYASFSHVADRSTRGE